MSAKATSRALLSRLNEAYSEIWEPPRDKMSMMVQTSMIANRCCPRKLWECKKIRLSKVMHHHLQLITSLASFSIWVLNKMPAERAATRFRS